ncbi:diamine N-acetyltransferase [Ancylomarina subtilis]|uniref:Diamine N-acetyltransferase n=1 Tax=Ancylomarina subtilis TaxID=1639035 RepID=A0A4Q7VE46_9BACT|nr:GNAT family N-acetyltransferase [Ancylomarina subtilis]RZT93352.1 diamine N-acetyltransferase [Ancylomarina subtilis]
MQILENKSIRLRALEPQDLKLLYKWENNSDIWEVSHCQKPFSLFVLKQYLENSHLDIYESKQLRLVIELKENKEPIGLIDLFDFDPFHNRAGIGVLLHDKIHRQKGYASEALETLINYCFKGLQLHQLYCNITTNNQASIDLFGAKGFEITGTKKQWIKSQEGWKDEHFLQLLNLKQ